jgi:hypothetical protein
MIVLVSTDTDTASRRHWTPLQHAHVVGERERLLGVVPSDGAPGNGGGQGAGTISIELSPSQVDRVVRGAADRGNMSVLLSGLSDVREVLAREPSQMEDSRLSRSLLAGLLMLASFPTDGSYIGNAEIARILDMNPSTTHRYVSTLVAVGLLERDPATRRYRLV